MEGRGRAGQRAGEQQRQRRLHSSGGGGGSLPLGCPWRCAAHTLHEGVHILHKHCRRHQLRQVAGRAVCFRHGCRFNTPVRCCDREQAVAGADGDERRCQQPLEGGRATEDDLKSKGRRVPIGQGKRYRVFGDSQAGTKRCAFAARITASSLAIGALARPARIARKTQFTPALAVLNRLQTNPAPLSLNPGSPETSLTCRCASPVPFPLHRHGLHRCFHRAHACGQPCGGCSCRRPCRRCRPPTGGAAPDGSRTQQQVRLGMVPLACS